ncbi:hypothetical protein O1611_g6607 [Lasiodiplodia mahajangana]|uniref:Uncharacterized protein n=1 Tax=Lasiodiplodia mahajangana TaxID=1108764 RepID=A0ACC2JHX1_9PEZI|nr:hypothetical protein O1611_g6607 [Lasiodiplodia mahajangana]
MAETVGLNSLSLAELYLECVTSFAEFVGALTEPDCGVICRDEIQLPRVFEEFGRTKIWGDQTTHIACRKYGPEQGGDQESISSVSDSDYSTDNEDEPQGRRMPKICLIFKQITDQVRSLHEISSLLRRPTVTNKFLRSKNTGPEPTAPRDPENIHLNVAFRPFDENHVLEKILQWRTLSKSLQAASLPDGTVPSAYDAALYQEIEEVRWFCQRLGRANTRRREQLRYWKSHPYTSKQPITITGLIKEPSITRGNRDIVPLEDQKEDSRSQVSTLKPPDPLTLNGGQKPMSVFSKLSFSTVALSDVHDTKTNIRPRTIYAPTAMGPDRAISIPAPPKIRDEETTFPCPYCGMGLEFRDMRRDLWKRHVFRDLRPYICTFEDCHSAEKLFSSRHEWKHHEFQMHRREYVCRRCRSRCISRREMSMHLQKHYEEPISPDQMSILLDLCNRQIDPSSDNTDSCILCGDQVCLSAWHDHVGAHMETLSLFVLPVPDDDDEETEGSIISGKADMLDPNDAGSRSAAGASSLRFSDTPDRRQTVAELPEIASETEAEYTSEILSRGATKGDNSPILSTNRRIPLDLNPREEEPEEDEDEEGDFVILREIGNEFESTKRKIEQTNWEAYDVLTRGINSENSDDMKLERKIREMEIDEFKRRNMNQLKLLEGMRKAIEERNSALIGKMVESPENIRKLFERGNSGPSVLMRYRSLLIAINSLDVKVRGQYADDFWKEMPRASDK